MHRLPTDEVFHFYLGDAVEMLQLHPDGRGEVIRLGTDLAVGERPQVLAPGDTWQGSRLVPGGRWALLGTTVAPGFDFADYTSGRRSELIAAYPGFSELITALTRQ
jgi:predicted cupin superfamily sugar epimerase